MLEKCNNCDSIIDATIQRRDGLPSGIGFQMKDGGIVNLCADCLMKVGRMDNKGKHDFFKKLGVEWLDR